MIEKVLLIVLVAGGIIAAASSIDLSFHKLSDRVECAMTGASICVLDDDKEL